jgi:hypothetical protein
MATAPAARPGTPWRTDLRAAARWLALGALAGGLAGLVIGGVGGRLLMLVLRRESPGALGLTSDDGFEIGEVTFSGSLNLLVFTALLGAMAGVAYVLVRPGVPRLARIPLATVLGGTAGGTAVLEPDGIDLLVLDPLLLAVAGFIALPALWATATAILVERGARRVAPFQAARPLGRLAPVVRLVVTLAVLALIATSALDLIDELERIY